MRTSLFSLLLAALTLMVGSGLGSVAHAGNYDLTSRYRGPVGDTRGWLIEWQVPEVTNHAVAQVVPGQWYYNLESGIFGGAGDFGVYYFGDDDGLSGNNTSCEAYWSNLGGLCNGAYAHLQAGRRVAFKYEWCDASHTGTVTGDRLCVWVSIDSAAWHFLASDKRSTVEMYAHDVEWFDDQPEPIVSCATPTRMLRQQVKTPTGQWVDMKGDLWDFYAARRYIYLNRLSGSWESCRLGAPPSGCGKLTANTGLLPGDTLSSCKGGFKLAVTSSGDLELKDSAGQLAWTTNVAGQAGRAAIMQSDGNFVLYSTGGKPLWASGTYKNPGASLVLQDDGDLVVKSSSGAILWSSHQATADLKPAVADASSGHADASIGHADASTGQTDGLSGQLDASSRNGNATGASQPPAGGEIPAGCTAAPGPDSPGPLAAAVIALLGLLAACCRRRALARRACQHR